MANDVVFKIGLDISKVEQGVNSIKQRLLSLINKKQEISVDIKNNKQVLDSIRTLKSQFESLGKTSGEGNILSFVKELGKQSDLSRQKIEELADKKRQLESASRIGNISLVTDNEVKKAADLVNQYDLLESKANEYEQAQKAMLDSWNAFNATGSGDKLREYESASSTFHALEADINNSYGSIEGLKTELDSVYSELDRLQMPAGKAFGYLVSDVERTKTSIESLLDGASEADRVLAGDLLSRLDAITNSDMNQGQRAQALLELKGELTDLNSRMRENAISSYDAEINSLNSDILATNSAVETIKGNISTWASAAGIEESSLAFGDLQTVIDSTSDSLSGLQQKYTSVSSEIASTKGQLSQALASAGTGGIAEGLESSGNRILSIFQNIKNVGSSVFGGILGGAVSGFGDQLNGTISQVADLGSSIVSSLGKTALGVLKPFGSAIFEISKTLLGFNIFKSIGGFITSLGSRILRLASGALIFRAMSAALRQLRKDVVEAFGTYLNYDSDLSSSINNLKSQFTELKGQLASAFAPIVEIIVPYLSQFVGWCVSAANALSALIASLTGKSSWKKAVVNSTGAVGDSASKAAKDLNDASDAADELKEKLGSYDELNIIGDDSDNKKSKSGSGSGGSGGSGAKGADISYVEQSIGDDIKNLADWLKDMWEKADFTELGALLGQKLKDALDKIPWAEIKQKAYKVGKSIATFLNGFFRTPGLGTTLGKTIAEFINTGLSAAYGFVHNFDFSAFGQFLADGINGIIDTLDFDLAATTLREGFNGIFQAIKTVTDPITGIQFGTLGAKLGKFIQDATRLDWKTAEDGFRGLGRGIADFANNLITPETLGSLGSAVAGCVNTISGAISGFVNRYNWEQLGASISSFFNNLVKDVNWVQLGSDFGTAIHGLITAIKTFIANLDYRAIMDAFTDFFKGVFENLTWSDVALIAVTLLAATLVKTVASNIATLIAANGGIGNIILSAIGNALTAAAPLLLPAAIIAAIAIGIPLVVEGLSRLDWDAIGSAIMDFVDKAIGVITFALDFIINLMENIEEIPVLGWIFKVINAPLKFTLELIEHILKGDLIEWLKAKWDTAKNFVVNLSESIAGGAAIILQWIVNTFGKAKEWTANIIASFKDKITESPIFKWVYDKFKAASEWAANLKANFKDAIENAPVLGWLYDKFKSATEWVADIAAQVADKIDDGVKSFCNWVTEWAEKGINFLCEVGDGIAEGVSTFCDWVTEWAGKALDWVVNVTADIGEGVGWLFEQIGEVFTWGKKTTYEIEIEARAEEAQSIVNDLLSDLDTRLGDIQTAADNCADSISNLISNREKSTSAAEDEAFASEVLATKYFDLAEKTNRSAEEEAIMRSIAEELIKTYPELNSLYDEQTGLIDATRSEVEQLVEARKQEAIMDTLIQEYGKIGAAILKNNEVLETARGEWNKLHEGLVTAGVSENDIQHYYDLAEAIRTGNDPTGELAEELEDLGKQFEDKTGIEGYSEQILKAANAYGTAQENADKYKTEAEYLDGALEKAASGINTTTDAVDGLNKKVDEANSKEDISIGAEANTSQAEQNVDSLSGKAEEYNGSTYTANLDADTSGVTTGISTADGELTVFDDKDHTTDLKAENKTQEGISAANNSISTVPEEKTTDLKAQNDVSETTNTVVQEVDKVPSEKKVTFSDIGGAILATVTALAIKLAINSIPDEKKVTFKVEDQTKEPVKTIKDTLKSVLDYNKDTILKGIKDNTDSTLRNIKSAVSDALITGSDSIKSKANTLKSNITSAISSIHQEATTKLPQIAQTFKTNFESAKASAQTAISAIKTSIASITGKTVNINVTLTGLDNVYSQLNSIPHYQTVIIQAVWQGDTNRSFYATVYWENVELALGGVYKNGRWSDIPQMASGGIFRNGFWDSIPMYAGGTARAHGTMFIAGENGAEIVGNIGGRTEVLNKSQLAATMFSSVRSAMSDTGADLANAIIMNMVSAANAMITNIVYVSEVLKEGFNGVYEVVNGAATLSHADWAEYFKKFGDYVNATSKGFGRLEELSQLQRELPKAITSNADLEYKRMLEIYNGVNRRLEMACDILREIEIANKGGNEMQMHIDLDGTTIYERMVQLDKGYSRITGISGFGG